MNLTRKVLECNVLRLVEHFMPSSEDQKKLHFSLDSFPFVLETLALIDSLLP